MDNVVFASQIDIDSLGTIRIWCPGDGRPYWVIAGKPNAGPDLTDGEIKMLGYFLKYWRRK